MDFGLRDKVVIVTGGSAGIGRATALRFAREGARVAVWDVDERTAADVLSGIRERGGEGLFRKVDVASAAAVEKGVAEVVERFGGIDVLVNNAGIVRDAQLVKWKDGAVVSLLSDAQWDEVVDVNLKGVFLCTRTVAPHMIARGRGVILQASSVVGLYGNFGQTNYAATKAGVIALTRTRARELGRHAIRVNAVAPGFVRTEIVGAMPEKMLASMVERTPAGRMGAPEDVANAYAWLASDEASFVHGAVLCVDGGLVLGT